MGEVREGGSKENTEMLRDYVDGADQMQDVLDQLFHVSSSSSKLFVSNPVKGSLIFDILFRRQDNRLALPPMPAESIQVF